METFLPALVVFALAFAGLGLGLLLGRPALKGTCAGLACVKGADCSACPRRQQGDVS